MFCFYLSIFCKMCVEYCLKSVGVFAPTSFTEAAVLGTAGSGR